MGTSPAVSKALAHSGDSASQVDLSVLSRDGGGDDEGSEKGSEKGSSDNNGDEVHLQNCHALPTSCTNTVSAQPPLRFRHESMPWDIERPSSPDNSHHGSQVCFKIAKMQAKEKANRADRKADSKHKH